MLWRGGYTPLYVASVRGHLDVVKRRAPRAKENPLLTMTNPEIDFLALDAAAHEGRSEVVRELIQQVGIQG